MDQMQNFLKQNILQTQEKTEQQMKKFTLSMLIINFRLYENIYTTIGGRNDRHTTAGDEQSYRVTGAYDLGGNSKIRSSY